MGNAIRSPTVRCFRFVCENLTTFPFGKHIVGKLDSWAFVDIFSFEIKFGVYEKLPKNNDCFTKTYAATLAAMSILELDCALPWPWLCVLA